MEDMGNIMDEEVFVEKVGWNPYQVHLNMEDGEVEFCMPHPLSGLMKQVDKIPLSECQETVRRMSTRKRCMNPY